MSRIKYIISLGVVYVILLHSIAKETKEIVIYACGMYLFYFKCVVVFVVGGQNEKWVFSYLGGFTFLF